ncbi:MAG: glycosyltransferase family 4 protein [Anaerolineales bacterium]
MVIYGALDQRSGGYLYDRMLVEGMRELGDRVEVLSLPAREYALNLLDNFSARRFTRVPYDILLQDELNHPSLFNANRRLRRVSPIVTIVHHLRSSEPHPAPLRSLYRRIEKAYLRTVDGAVYNSHVTRATVEALMGKPLSSVVAAPGADHLPGNVDFEVIEARARQPGPLQIVFIGNLIPRKGLHRLIRALNGIRADEWHLSVVGSLEFDRDYSDRIRRTTDQPNIRLMGALDHAEIAELLSQSHVLAMPSAYEGFGIAYLEGMAFGLPAVASAAGGASDIVQDGVNGYLVPPSDEAQLRERLSRLSTDRDLLAEMGRAALEMYQRHPTWNGTVRRVREFMMEFVSNCRLGY